jgi:RimJ/RimL family protein N-acetyltransferase
MSDRIVLPAEGLADGATALRAWRDTDVRALTAACQDPEIPRWLTRLPQPYGEADARAYLLARYESIHAGTSAPFAIVDALDRDRLLGSISLMRIAWEHRRAEVGYWLAREARGHGHTTRAVRLICAWGFNALGFERIDLFAAAGNVASQRVAERAGFTREGVLRCYLRGRDRQLDAVAYGLLADELTGAGARSAR